MSIVNVSRRNLLKGTGVVGGGLVVGFSLQGCANDQSPALQNSGNDLIPNGLLQVKEDNTVVMVCPRDEMGQGVMTGLITILAEELDVDPQRVEARLASAHKDYNNPGMGLQATGGSTSVNAHYVPLRQTGAAARAVILEAASAKLGVPASSLATEDGHVIHNGDRLPYGDFVAVAAQLQMPEEPALKSPSDFRYIGKKTTRLDALAKATGTAVYGIDGDVPGMKYAKLVRSPVPGAGLVSADLSAAKSSAGVVDVVEIENGVAVVADSFWQAKQGAEKLKLEWETTELSKVSSADIKADYAQALVDGDAVTGESEGDINAALDAADDVLEAEFWTPYLAHAPMETMNALVHLQGDRAEVWAGTQGPQSTAGIISRVTGIESSNITVHPVYLGGGFGRRAAADFVEEATRIAMATNHPIKLIWTREDDIRNAAYRPASLMKIKASVDDSGMVDAWDATRVGTNIMGEALGAVLPAALPGMPEFLINAISGTAKYTFRNWAVDETSVEGLIHDYDFPNREVRHITKNHGVPPTVWRSVGHSFTAFAKEVMMDELAVKSALDPIDFRLKNTANNARLNNVIKVAGEKMKSKSLPEGHFLGVAAHGSFLTDVAQVAEVSIEGDEIRVHSVTCVVDCGTAVNPDVVRAQMEGSIMFGLTAALYGELTLENGAFAESNFHNYPILRMDKAPSVDVVIIESNDAPTGVGEPGLPPIAPAVANAVYAATGKRLRSLPLNLANA